MSVSNTASTASFSLNQTTSTFTFTFRALTSTPTDIKAIITTNSTNQTLAYTTDYTVAVDADGVGGVLTLVSPATHSKGTLTVYRDTTNLQESDYDDYNQFPADTLETDLDKRTLVSQEQAEKFTRTLLLPITVTGVSTTLPIPVAQKVIGWSVGALSLCNYDNAADSVTAAASSATSALASQTAAASSATTASGFATAASTSATTAASHATTALNSLLVAINVQTGNYTLALSDVNKLVDLNSAGTITLTIPSSGAVAFPTGSVIALRQKGAGQVVISTSATVTLNKETGLKTTGQHAVASLVKLDTDTWLAIGALEA